MYDNNRVRKILTVCLILSAFAATGNSKEIDLNTLFREGIPRSPFANVFYGYANAMLEHGRDTYGPQKTGLFLSALDRKTLGPLKIRPPAPGDSGHTIARQWSHRARCHRIPYTRPGIEHLWMCPGKPSARRPWPR